MNNYELIDLKEFARASGIELIGQKEIADYAIDEIDKRYSGNASLIKQEFDGIVSELENIAYRQYIKGEDDYGKKVFRYFANHLLLTGQANDAKSLIEAISMNFRSFDRFFLSLSQARKSRAGKTFEIIHNSLFKMLNYPFTEQAVINGKPDFLMPSREHYSINPMDCIIFTAKRTLRERWRQIVTEGTRGLGFFLATLDTEVSDNQLSEMMKHRIYLVVPLNLKMKHYSDAQNVLSFRQFFADHLDPAMERWRRNGVI